MRFFRRATIFYFFIIAIKNRASIANADSDKASSRVVDRASGIKKVKPISYNTFYERILFHYNMLLLLLLSLYFRNVSITF